MVRRQTRLRNASCAERRRLIVSQAVSCTATWSRTPFLHSLLTEQHLTGLASELISYPTLADREKVRSHQVCRMQTEQSALHASADTNTSILSHIWQWVS